MRALVAACVVSGLSCGGTAAPSALATVLPGAAAAGTAIGIAAPIEVIASDPDGRWVVLCQAAADDNGDGQIAAVRGPGMSFVGDEAHLRLVVGAGPGAAIRRFEDASPDGRRVVVRVGDALVLVDVVDGTATTLPGGAPGDRASPAARFSRDGRHVAYVVEGAVIAFDGATGAVARARFDDLVGGVVAYDPASARVEVAVPDVAAGGPGQILGTLEGLGHDCSPRMGAPLHSTPWATRAVDLRSGAVTEVAGRPADAGYPIAAWPTADGRLAVARDRRGRVLVAAGVYTPDQASEALAWMRSSLETMPLGPLRWE